MNYKDKLLKIRVLEPTEKILAAAKEKRKKPVNRKFNYDPAQSELDLFIYKGKRLK